MKKYFVAVESANCKKWKYLFIIYEVVDNKLSYVEEWYISYWMTRWPEAEVKKILIENGYLSQDIEPYYYTNDEYDIKYITPFRQ